MSNIPGLLFYSDKLVYRIGRHLFLFISMILLFSWIMYSRDESDDVFWKVAKGVFVNALFFFAYAYITAYLLIPNILSRKRYLLLAIVFLATGFLISYLKFIFSDYLFYSAIAADPSSRFLEVDIAHILVNTKDMTFIVAIFLIAKFSKDNYYMRKRLNELQEHHIRSEIKLLKNQLDPHVVFNNLNNIYSLSLNNSSKVADSLARFNSVLRYYFIDGKNQLVPLEIELKKIEDFISLEKLRYGERLTVEYTVEGSCKGHSIIPFVLFSFVENCFEHGCSIDFGDAWIRIIVKIEKDAITFHASNSKPKNVMDSEKERKKHVGRSTRKKLDLLYPGKYLVRVDDRNDMYYLDLKLRC
ncbi:sensor histidine kinase [Bacteroidota bacterium]